MKKIIIPIILLAFCSGLSAQTKNTAVLKVFSRHNYYMNEPGADIVCILPDSLNTADFQLTLLKNGRPLKAVSTSGEHRIIARADLTLFPEGTTNLQYKIIHNKKTYASGSVVLVKRSEKQNAVQIDLLTGGLIADGLPFFPFGFYCGPVNNLPETEVTHGFNMIGPYQDNLPPGFAARKSYMDRCAQLGIKVQYGVNSLVGSGHNGDKGLDKSRQEKLDILRSEVIAFRDHPALLSWYINDEPDGQGRPPEVLEEAYNLIHQLDPYHPVSVVFMMPGKANDFRNTMDIAMTDPYPIPGPADKVMNDVSAYRQAYQYEKSVWLVPQAFGGQEMWAREPTAAEIRLMTYMGLLSGAKGIQYYVHAAGNLNPQSVSAWSACSDMAVETAQMTPFLLSADESPQVTAKDPGILTKTFMYKGNLLVIALNNENVPRSFDLDVALKDSTLNTKAELWFENRSVTFDRGHIRDIIDAYGTRIYLVRSRQSAAGSKAAENNLTHNPGFEQVASPGLATGSNVTVTSRSKADPGATFFTDSRQSVDGLFSLRLINPADSGGKKIRLLPLVMNKGNSYTVSVWAKAKQNEHLPSFRMTVDGMNQDHTFPLTADWKKYSFTYEAPLSSTTSIPTLELLQQGTAWFDLLEVNPDPVIGYHINAEHHAVVSVSSSSNAVLRYEFNKEPSEKSALYKVPLDVTEAGTIYAALFNNHKAIAATKRFIPVNQALGKPVTFNNTYSKEYPASGAKSLTDGMMGTTAFKDKNWLGYSGKDMDIILDMQSASSAKSVSCSFLADPNSGIFLPAVMEVYTSADGADYTLAGTYKNTAGSVRGEPYLQQFSVPLKNESFRYLKIIARTVGTIPEGYLFKGSTAWLFTDEILVQ